MRTQRIPEAVKEGKTSVIVQGGQAKSLVLPAFGKMPKAFLRIFLLYVGFLCTHNIATAGKVGFCTWSGDDQICASWIWKDPGADCPKTYVPRITCGVCYEFPWWYEECPWCEKQTYWCRYVPESYEICRKQFEVPFDIITGDCP
ncbi:MAG: hypothetical protein KatS3mg130_1115 [Candidatus Sumerlaea sp.]|uniref:Uncharacterized protein n=1 Tax=Sumerlaea chitinivorans TaxID=2250252 RepID=A0A2Z4Y8P7_SUMC1|nr:hypothetical protein BRCON_2868 [Candidatus Sumerlaea chitinivorans]GIX44707.1 MAG: hypothetical protein KatS3mg130_1115 [Candidatus Sumerlaea sp.]